MIPNEKYYGVNFSKLSKNYIEFRYIGGENYEYKADKVLDLMDYFIMTLYKAIKYPDYTEENVRDINKILKKYKKVLNAYNSYDQFKVNYPKLVLTVNLSNNHAIIDTYYMKLREIIFNLLTETSIDEGLLNYDADLSRMQIQNADFKAWKIENIEIVESIISNSNIIKCDFYKCTINNSSCEQINAFNQSLINNSKVSNSYINQSSVLKNCYFCGKHGMLNGIMYDGIFREGRIGNQAKLGDKKGAIETAKLSMANAAKAKNDDYVKMNNDSIAEWSKK
jgi:hypothetical protein